MATTFDEIYDLALVGLRDYKLDNLYSLSPTNFKNYLKGFLKRAIPKFTNCNKDLESLADFTNDTFTVSLELKEQTILADLMVIEWFRKEVNDVTQFNIHLNDTDFKHYAEANNLKEKSAYLVVLREIVNQEMVDYGLVKAPWANWGNGTFI